MLFSPATIRYLKAFARTPLIPPPAPIVVPMATFRSYAPTAGPRDPANPSPSEKNTHKNEQTSGESASTDDIAHSDAAYGGSGPNPQEAAKKIEHETTGPGGMKSTAANPKASKPPKESSD